MHWSSTARCPGRGGRRDARRAFTSTSSPFVGSTRQSARDWPGRCSASSDFSPFPPPLHRRRVFDEARRVPSFEDELIVQDRRGRMTIRVYLRVTAALMVAMAATALVAAHDG